MENFEHAMFNINKSISTFEKKEIYDWLAIAYSVKGGIYLKEKKYKWAIYWFDKSNLLHVKADEFQLDTWSFWNLFKSKITSRPARLFRNIV